MTYDIDARIRSSCFKLASGALSELFLRDESRFPWFILVPRVAVLEVFQLEPAQGTLLFQEISCISQWLQRQYKSCKINVASLGNVVSQLHVHVVGRHPDDAYWPHSIWQPDYLAKLYTEEERTTIMHRIEQENLIESYERLKPF